MQSSQIVCNRHDSSTSSNISICHLLLSMNSTSIKHNSFKTLSFLMALRITQIQTLHTTEQWDKTWKLKNSQLPADLYLFWLHWRNSTCISSFYLKRENFHFSSSLSRLMVITQSRLPPVVSATCFKQTHFLCCIGAGFVLQSWHSTWAQLWRRYSVTLDVRQKCVAHTRHKKISSIHVAVIHKSWYRS